MSCDVGFKHFNFLLCFDALYGLLKSNTSPQIGGGFRVVYFTDVLLMLTRRFNLRHPAA